MLRHPFHSESKEWCRCGVEPGLTRGAVCRVQTEATNSVEVVVNAVEVGPEASGSQVVTPWDVQGAVVEGKQVRPGLHPPFTSQGRLVEQPLTQASSLPSQVAIDYTKLVDQFGTKLIDQDLLDRFERLTGRKPHLLLRRGTFFSHR